jgi:phospholipid transport system substrate-binding protein
VSQAKPSPWLGSFIKMQKQQIMKTFTSLKRFFVLIALVLGTCMATVSAHAEEAPDALVKRISQEVLDTVKNDKDLQTGKYRRVQELVESKILPYVDFQKTTALVAGRFWRDATAEQQKQLTNEFRNLLVHTYSGALSQVKDQTLEFKPLRADPADTEVEVRSQVVHARSEPIQMNYRLVKTADGWKIYDVNILGAWLIETYKGNFAAEINRGGIEGLIRTLVEKNKRLAASANPGRKNAG